MITADNIRDIRFTKTMGGYKVAEVDAFLDQCAATVEAMTNEREENNRKMQVLAETIVDYRNQEDSIRTALLSAQRMSETVIKEAQEKADQILADAETKAAALVADAEEKAKTVDEEAKKSIENELDELARIQKEVAAFRARLLSTYREHLTLIGVLSDDVKDTAEEEPVNIQSTTETVESAPTAEESNVDQKATEEPVFSFAEESVPAANDVKIDISAFELKDEE